MCRYVTHKLKLKLVGSHHRKDAEARLIPVARSACLPPQERRHAATHFLDVPRPPSSEAAPTPSAANQGGLDMGRILIETSLWGARHDYFRICRPLSWCASLGVLRRVNKAWKAGIESNVWAWEAAARSLLGSMWQPAGCSWHDGCCAYPARACDGRRSAGLKLGKAPPLVIDTSAQGTRRPGSPAMRLPSSTLPTLVWE
jgi:hypothetical protein